MRLKKKTVALLISVLMLAVRMGEAQGLLQNVSSRVHQSLDGTWQIIVDPMETGYYNHSWKPKKNGYFIDEKPKTVSDRVEYDFDTSDELYVPSDWNTQNDKLYYYEGTVWYRKKFITKKEDKKKYHLYFGAINYRSIVYLNGERVGEHVGGFTSFNFDVTDLLKAGQNTVVVKVDNTRDKDGVPTINTDWWNYGGITRSVLLVETPQIFLEDYSVSLSKDKTIEGWVKLNDSSAGKVEISIEGIGKQQVKVKDGKASFKFDKAPKLWSFADPYLYPVTLSFNGETIQDEIGFKYIDVKGKDILLNGESVFLKGISIHEEAPISTGRVTTAEECQILLDWAQELGCNFIRLAHYPHSETMVRMAEKRGFLIWSEIPVYWTINYENESTYQNAENQLAEMIDRDKNRVGIGLWSVANETPVIDARNQFLNKLIKKTREMDPTRLICAALDTHITKNGKKTIDDPLGEYVDVIGINSYCGWYGGTPESCEAWEWASQFEKPMIMSEVGAGALQGLHGEQNERWTEEYQSAVYRYNIEMLKNIDFLRGVSPWILMDFRSPRRPLKRVQNDFNRKGLISEQGIKKEAFFILQDYYNSQPIQLNK
ncbi:beta galactosidase jelly roll domain-containing protein [Reichenbachiella carrageenanivorans]|uniref:Beta-glucuronidase n=1 Tax=Reichenbachiella carrageenanivorans TaxID=2979869 RepID=A0ABY6CUT9_9BACT|nr:glycoside hydrolase family 2 TIM barrel-domain containing protein [Reichenbachiella carrageenanivorans]UXX77697.1 beta galactosidase jelly roll domain-containing protein [Reichenbachiella carrageenanivorans]